VWVKEQKAGMAFADVKIFDFDVYPGKIDGEVARVPNVLSSQEPLGEPARAEPSTSSTRWSGRTGRGRWTGR